MAQKPLGIHPKSSILHTLPLTSFLVEELLLKLQELQSAVNTGKDSL